MSHQMKLVIACVFIALSLNLSANTLELAKAHIEANDTESAIRILQELQNEESTAEIEYNLAIAYQNSNQLDLAITHAANAIVKDPNVSNHHLVFAETQGQKLASNGGALKKLGLVKRVRKSFVTAVKLDPSNIRAREGLTQFYLMAPGIVGGSKKKALQQALAIFELDQQRAYPLLVETYRANKKPQKVTETLNQWKAAYPNDWNAVLASAYHQQSVNNHQLAYDLLSEWLEKNPDHSAASYQLGRLAAISGKYLDEGEIHLNKYLTIEHEQGLPQAQHAHWRLALIYQHKDNLTQAKFHVDKGLEIAPENKQLLELSSTL